MITLVVRDSKEHVIKALEEIGKKSCKLISE